IATTLLERVTRSDVELRTDGAGRRVVVVVVDEAVRSRRCERRLLVEDVDHGSEDFPVLEALVGSRKIERRERLDGAARLLVGRSGSSAQEPLAVVGNRQALIRNLVPAADVADR